MKRIFAASILLTILAFCITSFTAKELKPIQKQKLRKIVIDAGHGGGDHGAGGKYSKEKDVSLAIAMALQKEIESEIPDVETYMTRTTDVYESPITKANKANDAKGDLFIAIHCNWAPGQRHSEFTGYKTETYTKKVKGKRRTFTRKVKQYRTWYSPSEVRGTETFIWNVNKTGAKEASLQSHEDMFMDSATIKELEEFEKKDPTKMILYSIKTKQFFDRSARLALTVEEEFRKTGRFSRQAQQRGKGIWVLQAVAMPAILVETGFISNPDEEDYLNSPEGQKETAQVITNAIKRYKYSLETTGIKPAGSPENTNQTPKK